MNQDTIIITIEEWVCLHCKSHYYPSWASFPIPQKILYIRTPLLCSCGKHLMRNYIGTGTPQGGIPIQSLTDATNCLIILDEQKCEKIIEEKRSELSHDTVPV